MYSILNIGKTGLKSMQTKMDAVADELANVNTDGYKKKEISFQELLHNDINNKDVLVSTNVNNASINVGSKSGIGTVNFGQGALRESRGDFHMAIEGKGFFGVRDNEGRLMLTRNGGFHLNEDYSVTDDSGYPLEIDLYVPINEWNNGDVSISKKGDIFTEVNGETILLGRVVLYNPEVLDSLTPLGEGRYMPSPNVTLYDSIEDGDRFGNILHHFLENSNVEMSRSIVDMLTTQRAYSLNSKAIQTTDEIMSIINGIKR